MKAVVVQVMTNLPVDAIPIEITLEELSCESGEGREEGRDRMNKEGEMIRYE